jgi:hypothetical protein
MFVGRRQKREHVGEGGAVVAAGGGEVGEAGQAQPADGQVVQARPAPEPARPDFEKALRYSRQTWTTIRPRSIVTG